MAEYSSRHGKRDSALSQYLAVVQNDPTKPNGWHSLISEYIRAGKTDDAVAAAKKAIAAIPAESARQYQFQNVIDSAVTLKALEPEKTLVGLMLGIMEPSPEGEAAAKSLPIIRQAIVTTATAQAVVDQLRPIADTAPRLAPLQMLLVQNYLIASNAQEVAANPQKAASNREEAAKIALRSLSLAPASAELARIAAIAVAGTGQWAQALPAAQKWSELSTPENRLQADLFLAELHRNLQDYPSMLNDLSPYVGKAKENPKDYAPVILLRAQALLMRGDDPAAADLLAPLLPNYPQMRQAWRELSQILPNTLAEKWLERLTAATPADQVDEQIQLAIAWHSLFQQRPRFAGSNDPKHKEAAVAILDRLATAAPDNPYVIQTRAILAEMENRLGAAEQGYRRALELKPDLAVSLNNLANMIGARGDLKEALSLAQRAVTASPSSASFHDTLGDLHLKNKDYPSALQSYKNALNLEPRNLQRPIKLAQAFDQAGQTQELSKLLDLIDKMTLEITVTKEQNEAIRQLRNKVPKTASR
jgi:tetratricopeptide (TPR) repeat protein